MPTPTRELRLSMKGNGRSMDSGDWMTPPIDFSGLGVDPARTDADIKTACAIMIEAADWLKATGQPLWRPEYLTPDKVVTAPDIPLYLARIDGDPSGTFLLQPEDPAFWPDAKPGEALYLHKLAVRRQAAGSGLSR